MRRNILALGERSIQGDYGMVTAAGELAIEESTIKRLSAAGSVTISHSQIKKGKVAGSLLAEASDFQELKAFGSTEIHGICKGNLCSFAGAIAAELLECKVLHNSSGSKRSNLSNSNEWSGAFHAVTFESASALTLNFEYRFQNIISTEALHSDHEIECENFYSLSQLSAVAVNAEYIFLLNGESIRVDQVTGSHVKIKNSFRPDKKFKQIPKYGSYKGRNGKKSIALIHTIEADHIEIESTRAQLVCGEQVNIGDLCIIDRVEYRESIQISEKAVVNEVVKV